MKRRTEITIEIDRVTIISQSKTHTSWCSTCAKRVSMMTVCEAAEMLQLSETVIHRLAETGRLHLATTAERLLLICPDSLLALLEDERMSPTGRPLPGWSDVAPAD